LTEKRTSPREGTVKGKTDRPASEVTDGMP
jgi:hypothetical protein